MENTCNIKFTVLPICAVAAKLTGEIHTIERLYPNQHYIDRGGSEYPNGIERVYCTCPCHRKEKDETI